MPEIYKEFRVSACISHHSPQFGKSKIEKFHYLCPTTDRKDLGSSISVPNTLQLIARSANT